MSQGFSLGEDCRTAFDKVRQGKARFAIFKLVGETTAVVEGTLGEPTATWEQFVARFPEDDVRYGLFSMDYVSKEGHPRNKLVYIMWAPQCSTIKARMMISAYSGKVLSQFQAWGGGIGGRVQAEAVDGLDKDVVLEQITRRDTVK